MTMRKQVLAVTIGVLLALSMLSVLPIMASSVFNSGWENSGGSDRTDASAWTFTDSGSRCSVQSLVKSDGSYAMLLNNSAGASSVTAYGTHLYSTNYTTLYLGFDYYTTALPSNKSSFLVIGSLGTTSHTSQFQVEIVYDGSNPVWAIFDAQYNTHTNSSTTVAVSSWYRVIVNGTSTVSNKVSVWINDVLVVTFAGANSGSEQMDRCNIGAMNAGYGYGMNQVAPLEYFDRVSVGTTYADVSTSGSSSGPSFASITANTTTVSTAVKFSCAINDSNGINIIIPSWNNTGAWTNQTAINAASATTYIANITGTLNETVGNTVSALYYANNTLNIWGTSTQANFLITSNNTVWAASGSPSDIQTALNSVVAIGGGTVYIPAGTFTFNPSTVTMPYTNVPINIIGAGIGQTILQETVESTTSMFQRSWSGQNYNAAPIRISGISFIGHVLSESTSSNNAINIVCTLDFRIDHCEFRDFEQCAIGVGSNTGGTYHLMIRGVIDHNTFDNPYKDSVSPTQWAYGILIGGDTYGWDDNIEDYLGQYYPTTVISVSNIPAGKDAYVPDYGEVVPQPIYIENNNFTRLRHAIASNGGGYYVVRYNHFEKPAPYRPVDIHGSTGNPNQVGGRGLEAYGNIFDLTNLTYTNGDCAAFGLRGGGGVIWNNTIIVPNGGGHDALGLQLGNDSDMPWCNVHDLWWWNNTVERVDTTVISYPTWLWTASGSFTVNIDYFLRAPTLIDDGFLYNSYTYPHPLVETSSSSSPPSYTTIGITTTVAGTSAVFYTYFQTSSEYLSGFITGTNNTGHWVNQTWTAWGASVTQGWANQTLTLNSTVGEAIGLQVYANGTNGLWADTGLYITTTSSSGGPSTSGVVATLSTYGYDAVEYAVQRKTFFASGRYWVFYCSNQTTTSIAAFSSSTDGLIWANYTQLTTTSCTSGWALSVAYNGTYLAYVLSTSTNGNPLYFREGVPNSDGTISWLAAEQTITTGETNVGHLWPSITFDSLGMPWIAYARKNVTENSRYAYVTHSTSGNGTWVSSQDSPYKVSTINYTGINTMILALSNSRMVVIVDCPAWTIEVFPFDGEYWGAGANTTSAISSDGIIDVGLSAVVDGDYVDLAFNKITSHDLVFTQYTFGGSWSAETTIQLTVSLNAPPVLSIDSNHVLYCFWGGIGGIYYKTSASTGTSWGFTSTSNPWIVQTDLAGYWQYDGITVFSQAYENAIGVAYTNGSGSVYQLRFAILEIPMITVTIIDNTWWSGWW